MEFNARHRRPAERIGILMPEQRLRRVRFRNQNRVRPDQKVPALPGLVEIVVPEAGRPRMRPSGERLPSFILMELRPTALAVAARR